MNIINKLTIKHMTKNKRRTLVTIVGVIISVAMITGVITIGTSFMDMMRRDTIANTGDYHLGYKDVNLKQINAIKKHHSRDKVIISRDIGYAYLKGSTNKNKPYLFLRQYNKEGFKKLPIHIKEGRLPISSNEVVISEHILTSGGVKFNIGETLNLDIGNRYEKGIKTKLDQSCGYSMGGTGSKEELKTFGKGNYEIVGIIKSPNFEPIWAPGYTVLSYTDEGQIQENDRVNAFANIKGLGKNIYENTNKFAKDNGISGVEYNYELLKWSGITENRKLANTICIFVGIIITIIIISSISLIYNAFSISISERIGYLGMVLSVGATKAQIRKSVTFEAFIIGIIGVPVGIICGIGGIWTTFIFINPLLKSATKILVDINIATSIEALIVVVIVSIITIYISAYIPARKASKITPIEAIRQTNDIKLSRKTVKTSRFTRWLFGIEGEIALKNIKRNKKRYIQSVLSLVISIVLFLSITSFTAYSLKAEDVYSSDKKPDIVVIDQNSKSNKSKNIDKIKELDKIKTSVTMEKLILETLLDEGVLSKKAKEHNPEVNSGKTEFYIDVRVLGDTEFQKYSNKAGIEYNPKQIRPILIDTQKYYDSNKQKYIEDRFIKMKRGDKIDLIYKGENEGDTPEKVANLELAGTTNIYPLGLENVMSPNQFNIIMSSTQFENMINTVDKSILDNLIYKKIINITSDDPMGLDKDIKKLIGTDEPIIINNNYELKEQNKSLDVIMSIFIYGFITLMILVCIANILNTISTSIRLRTKEFAMLKSIGMTPKSFNKMIRYESLFYGVKALLYGLPISFLIMGILFYTIRGSIEFGFFIPWISIICAVIGVFAILSVTMIYASSRVRKENIIEALKNDSI